MSAKVAFHEKRLPDLREAELGFVMGAFGLLPEIHHGDIGICPQRK